MSQEASKSKPESTSVTSVDTLDGDCANAVVAQFKRLDFNVKFAINDSVVSIIENNSILSNAEIKLMLALYSSGWTGALLKIAKELTC